MARKTSKPILIASTSGVRGIIGNGLDPLLVTAYAAAFGTLVKGGTVLLGRDSRPSGEMYSQAVISGLCATGCRVIDIGIVPTPTVEIAVKKLRAAGGICITASHNPGEWNALKFFNDDGEFISPAQYSRLQIILKSGRFAYKPYNQLGSLSTQNDWIEKHIRMTLAQKVVKKAAIKRRRFKVVVDAINGAGSFALPELLEKLGVKVIRINCKGDGDFVHEPEPRPKNLRQLATAVAKHKADLGMACDPDADRLALVDENGRAISEEYTLALAVWHILKQQRGVTVINLSTSRVTADIAKGLASPVYYAKVGESNVIDMMRQKKALIGGEGNGGVIYPSFHAGRDSLIAAALVLSALAEGKRSLSSLVETFPKYYITKIKAEMPGGFSARVAKLKRLAPSLFGPSKFDVRDGLRIDFARGWAQVRASNTEPIFRLIVETTDKKLTAQLIREIKTMFSR